MRRFPALLALALCSAALLSAELHTVVVSGLGGEKDYAERFAAEADKLGEAAKVSAGADSKVIILKGDAATRDAIVEAFTNLQSEVKEDDTVAIFLVGHGSWDNRNYKFNIPGPDLTADRLGNLLDKLPAKRQLVVNMTSCSGAMLDELHAGDRIVITATKNGRERNVTMFSKYWTAAFEDPEADLDKDETITAQEAYDYAAGKVDTFYKSANRLATEHSRIEGNAAQTFLLARLGAQAELARNPELAPLFKKREQLRMKVDALKLNKDGMDESKYFAELQKVLIDLAMVDQELEEKSNGRSETPQDEKQ